MKENREISNFDLSSIDFGIDSSVKFAIIKGNEESKIVFQNGSKILVMRINIESKVSTAYIAGIKSIEKISNETTTLYLQLKKVCEKLAIEFGEFTYSLSSPNKNMKEWALSKGHEIFNWDETSYLGDEKENGDERVLICIKTFRNTRE